LTEGSSLEAGARRTARLEKIVGIPGFNLNRLNPREFAVFSFVSSGAITPGLIPGGSRCGNVPTTPVPTYIKPSTFLARRTRLTAPSPGSHMQDQNKLNIATAHLKGLVQNLACSPDEDQILQYHDIIKLFEEACKQDLSQFIIAAERIKPAAVPTALWHWQTRHPQKRSVEFAYFRGQVQRLIAYLMAAGSSVA
jgi:hypothetical protein